MRRKDYELAILVDDRPVSEFRDDEHEEVWIAVSRGQEFEIALGNYSSRRVLAVPTVDGLSVVNGKPGSFESEGYIIRPGKKIVIPGWRLDNESVARFEFGTVAQGYAAKTGHSPRNIGVIASAFFLEKVVQDDERGIVLFQTRSVDGGPETASPPEEMAMAMSDGDERVATQALFQEAEADLASPPQPELETDTDDVSVKFGRRDVHRVTVDWLEKASPEPDAVLKIRYDTARGLTARGIGCEPPADWDGR